MCDTKGDESTVNDPNIIQHEVTPKSLIQKLPLYSNLLHHLHKHLIDLPTPDSIVNLRHSTSNRRLLLSEENVPSTRFDAESMSDEIVERSSVSEVLGCGRCGGEGAGEEGFSD